MFGREYHFTKQVGIYLIVTGIINNISGKLPPRKLPIDILTLCRIRNIRRYKGCVCIRYARSRLKAVNILFLICVIYSFNYIIFSAVGVIGDCRVFNKYKVQICRRGHIIKNIGVNYVAVCIFRLYPFALFFLVG